MLNDFEREKQRKKALTIAAAVMMVAIAVLAVVIVIIKINGSDENKPVTSGSGDYPTPSPYQGPIPGPSVAPVPTDNYREPGGAQPVPGSDVIKKLEENDGTTICGVADMDMIGAAITTDLYKYTKFIIGSDGIAYTDGEGLALPVVNYGATIVGQCIERTPDGLYMARAGLVGEDDIIQAHPRNEDGSVSDETVTIVSMKADNKWPGNGTEVTVQEDSIYMEIPIVDGNKSMVGAIYIPEEMYNMIETKAQERYKENTSEESEEE